MQALAAPDTLAFGPFVLDLGARALLAGGERLALSSRAFDILALLVAERDRVVSKDEILTKVWRGIAVEENNLAVQMSALRRVLAEHAAGQPMILTIPGQGYRFVARLDAPAPPEFTRLGPVPAPMDAPSPAPRSPGVRLVRAAIGAAACACLVWFVAQKWPATPPPRLSIAVLPFRDLSDDHSQAHFVDAITDDLTTAVTHVPGAVVAPRRSSNAFKSEDLSAEQIGRALNVRYLVEGSLQNGERTFHINAHLIDAQTGTDVPSVAPFNEPRNPSSDAQLAIVAHIASALKVTLDAVESTRASRQPSDSLDFWDLYFMAAAIHDRSQLLPDMTQAQNILKTALVKNPGFVDALAELSQVLYAKVHLNEDPNEDQDYQEAKQSIARALKLAPNDDGALAAQGMMALTDGNISAAEASFEASLAENPFNLLSHQGLASSAWNLGKWEETIGATKRLLLMDPQGARTKEYYGTLGKAYFMAGRWQDSIDALGRSLIDDSETSNGRSSPLQWDNLFLMAAHDRAGHDKRADELFEAYSRRWPHRSIWRLSSYFHKSQVSQTGFQFLRDALRHLNMPEYAHLDADDIADESKQGDFDPVPLTIRGKTCIGFQAFLRILASEPPPLILDVGLGASTLHNAKLIPDLDAQSGGLSDILHQNPDAGTRPIILVGGGWYGWDIYKAIMHPAMSGIGNASWLCGGEEAIAEHGRELEALGDKIEDRRDP